MVAGDSLGNNWVCSFARAAGAAVKPSTGSERKRSVAVASPGIYEGIHKSAAQIEANTDTALTNAVAAWVLDQQKRKDGGVL